MDFDSIGDRLKDIRIRRSDCLENDKAFLILREEIIYDIREKKFFKKIKGEVPKILSPELERVFHIFVSMLDVKSFMKLAVTSKEMYKRCMENKKIKIPVDVRCLTVMNENGSPVEFDFSLKHSTPEQDEIYKTAFLKVPCKVNVRTVQMMQGPDITMESIHTRLKEFRVNKIDELILYCDVKEWKVALTIIKEFGVSSLVITHSAELDILRSILELNLKKLEYPYPIPVECLRDSPIPEISLPGIETISNDELRNIFWEIEWQSLRRLTIGANSVDWSLCDEDEGVPFLFNFYGTATIRCKTRDTLQIYLCEKPEILHSLSYVFEEDVFKYLAEKHPIVSCSSEQFRTFFAGFTTIDRSHKGALPENRPLCFILNENHFWMLDENENLMECSWEDEEATWKALAPSTHQVPPKIEHPALAKCQFWILLNKLFASDCLFNCHGLEEFDSWFDDFEILDFEFSGPLPSYRPLVFEGRSSREEGLCRIVLLADDRLLLCDYFGFGRIQHCDYLNRPPILLTAKNVMEILQDPNHFGMNFNISFATFRDGLELLKKPILFFQKRLLIEEKTETEVWYRIDETVRKVVWENGRLSLSEEDLRGAPPSFMKQVFSHFLENSWESPLLMELEQFQDFLKLFTVVPFDYSGSLTSDPLMAFVKNEIRHSCDKESTCQCTEVSILVWFLWNGTLVTICSWGKEEPQMVWIETSFQDLDVPPMLKSKDFLKNLLQAKYSETSVFKWFGAFEEFPENFKHCISFDYDGPLPEERPVIFQNNSNKENIVYFLLREDGTVIKRKRQLAVISFSLVSPNDEDIPPALKSIL